ncbi:MAG TPA: RagB/SusD family nutrient uptake outer membrane protein, partial [Bacteroidales bacterium]|nr:RagB/SusD family nutrient uptake outer membrane protein [Bacteroidales bacterium]
MERKHYISSLVLLIGLFMIFSGCKKFLQKDLQGSLTQQSFPETASDALLATNAAYESLREWNYNSGGYPILDIMSDDARKGSNPNDQSSTVGPYDNFTFSPTGDGLDRWWTTLYLGVKRANVVIVNLPDIDMDATLRTRYIAEARFIRGLIYFDFVRAWGGVQLVTDLTPPNGLTRASKEDVYALVLSDLQFASDNLPEKNEYLAKDLGRATKGAANAMLARVYLWLHDFPHAEEYA